MEKVMNSYETLFVVDCSLGEDTVKELINKFTTLIADNGAIDSVDEWGKRRLAYPINYITDGYYVLVSFKSEPNFPLELERVLGITEGVIRYMTTAQSEMAAKAAAPKASVSETAEVAEEVTEA